MFVPESTDPNQPGHQRAKGWNAALRQAMDYARPNVQPKGTAVPQGPRTEFVLDELRSALSAMTTFFGMDEDEASKPTFDKARQALNYAEIVMRPLEPWERQSLEDFRACVHRWHEKAVAKGYDGVEAMCDTALPYGTRDLRLVSASPAVAHGWQPIETAPKDGTVIALRRDQRVHSGRWGRGAYSTGWLSNDSDVVFAFSSIHPPTHWMPLSFDVPVQGSGS